MYSAAIDIMVPTLDAPIGQRIADFFVQNFDALGVKYIIWSRRIYEGSDWNEYSGSSRKEQKKKKVIEFKS